MRATKTAKPPTAPPAIAPTFVVLCEEATDGTRGVDDDVDAEVDASLFFVLPDPAVAGFSDDVVLTEAFEDTDAVASQLEFNLRKGAASDGSWLKKASLKSFTLHASPSMHGSTWQHPYSVSAPKAIKVST